MKTHIASSHFVCLFLGLKSGAVFWPSVDQGQNVVAIKDVRKDRTNYCLIL